MRNIEIKRTMQWLGKDLLLTVQNENGHIGTVVIGQPYTKNNKVHVTYSTWNRLGHKDDVIAELYVREAVLKYQCVVTCVCGIHLDDIHEAELTAIFEWVKKDIAQL